MDYEPTYEELKQRVQELERSFDHHRREKEPAPEQYRQLVENANEAIFVAQNYVFVYANPKAEELFGFSKRELTAKRLTDFIHEDDREMVERRHEKRLQGESPPTVYPFRVLCKSGEIKWVELKVGRFYWGNRPATVCFVADLSKRKKAEDFIKFQSMVMDEMLDHIVVTDLQGTIVYANKAIAKSMETDPVELQGSHVSIFGEDASRGVNQQELLEKTKKYDEWRGEILNYGPGRREMIMDCRTKLIADSQGRPWRMIGIGRDITQLKKTEDFLKENMLGIINSLIFF